jgi:hypothetical protein
VPERVRSIDVFCCGGGGGGYVSQTSTSSSRTTTGGTTNTCSCGATSATTNVVYSYTTTVSEASYYCGNGGQLVTQSNISVTPGQEIAIVVGAGGYSMSIAGGSSSAGDVVANGGSGYNSSSSSLYAKGRYYNGGYTSTYYAVYASYEYCSSCNNYIIKAYSLGAERSTTRAGKEWRLAEEGGYAFDDTSRTMYGCGGGYRTQFANCGDGFDGSYSNSSGIVMIKWGK